MFDDVQEQRLKRLVELSRELSLSQEIEPLLHTILSAACELTGSEFASILECASGSEFLQFAAASGLKRSILASIKIPVAGSIPGHVFTEGEALIVADVVADSRHIPAVDQVIGIETRSLLAVPMTIMGQKVGVLQVANKADSAHYNGEDVTILETLAVQSAIVLQSSRLQQAIQNTRQQIHQLDEFKSEFISVSSHEMRNPLGLILGHATFLRETNGDPFRDQLDVIIRNAVRLKEIIDRLILEDEESAPSGDDSRTISMKRLIHELVHSLQDDARQRELHLEARLPDGDLVIEGDAHRIGTALSHLVWNALTFTDTGGHIHVVAEQIPGFVKISVVDDGIGIPSKDLHRVFERFFQVESHLSRKHGGMGLGLSIARSMIETHNGRIWVESVEGEGSVFTVLLPLYSPVETAL